MLSLILALQSVWPVNNVPAFQLAETLAQPGDRIVLQAGDYEFSAGAPFQVDVGVTVTVAAGGRARIVSLGERPNVTAPALGQALRLESLDFERDPSSLTGGA